MAEAIYMQPCKMEELAEALGKLTENSKILGGGTDLIIQLRTRHLEPDYILCLGKIQEMKEIRREGEYLRVGAMCTHGEIAENAMVMDKFKALSMACGHVGSAQIRNKGTIGGSLANASVAGDMLPVLYLFGGKVEIFTKEGETRFVEARDFSLGVGKTVLSHQEAILAVWFPIEEGQKSCFVKLGGRKEVTIAEISLAMSWEGGNGQFHKVRGILGAVDTKPICLEEAPKLLGDCNVGEEEKNLLAESLSGRIQVIRENRKRQPKLRIRDCERVYKEWAVKGVVYDTLKIMEEMERGI